MGCLSDGVVDPDDFKLATIHTRASLRGTTNPERRKPMIVDDREREKETRIPTWDLGRGI